jgi:hypothetical protein
VAAREIRVWQARAIKPYGGNEDAVFVASLAVSKKSVSNVFLLYSRQGTLVGCPGQDMTISTPYANYLTILQGGKGIPYGGGQRPEGTVNHGFVSLKGKPDLILTIPEARDDNALADIIRKINAPGTALFSVGCVSSGVADSHGHRVTGYIEFAINDRNLVTSAMPYFEIFFHFTQKLPATNFSERVVLHWELLGATFLDARCDGLTCTIVINTAYHKTKEEAASCWALLLTLLGDHLAEIKDQGFNRIYQSS